MINNLALLCSMAMSFGNNLSSSSIGMRCLRLLDSSTKNIVNAGIIEMKIKVTILPFDHGSIWLDSSTVINVSFSDFKDVEILPLLETRV